MDSLRIEVWALAAARCSSLGVRCLSLGARCLSLGARCLSLGVRCLSLGARCLSLGARCLSLGAWCLSLGERCLSLFQSTKTGTVAHPPSYSISTRDALPQRKVARTQSWSLNPLSSAAFKNEWSYFTCHVASPRTQRLHLILPLPHTLQTTLYYKTQCV